MTPAKPRDIAAAWMASLTPRTFGSAAFAVGAQAESLNHDAVNTVVKRTSWCGRHCRAEFSWNPSRTGLERLELVFKAIDETAVRSSVTDTFGEPSGFRSTTGDHGSEVLS